MSDERRKGDTRPLEHEEDRISLTFLPATDRPFRWLPRHGEPYCIGEWLTQHFVRTLAWWPVYTATVTTLVLVVIVFHPFGLGR